MPAPKTDRVIISTETITGQTNYEDCYEYKYTLCWGIYPNQLPYLSLTGNDRVNGVSGCVHEMIAERFPKIAEFIPWHLCNVDGIPMHYIANSLFWLKENNKEFFESTVLVNKLGIDESDLFSSLQVTLKTYDQGFVKSILENRIPKIKEAFNLLLAKHGFKKPEGY